MFQTISKMAMSIATILTALVSGSAWAAESGLIVEYRESEIGVAAYATRLIVTPSYLRFDDGEDDGDFLLFDRSKRVIYNTNSVDKTILVIHNKKIKLPKKSDWTHKVDTDDEKVPSIGSSPVKHLVLLTNGSICYNLYAAEGLLPDAVKALAEYRRVLSVQHAEILVDMPGIERSPCDVANNIYLPDRHLQYGFPVRIRDMDGRMKVLVNYKVDVKLHEKLFKLPSGYREYRISEMRG